MFLIYWSVISSSRAGEWEYGVKGVDGVGNQFRLFILTSFIGQFVPQVGGELMR